MAVGGSALLEPPEHPEAGAFGPGASNDEFYEAVRIAIAAAITARPANAWSKWNRRRLFLRNAAESRACGLLSSRGLIRHQRGWRLLYIPARTAWERESVCHRT